MTTRDELVTAIAGRYAQGDRAERGRILDEFAVDPRLGYADRMTSLWYRGHRFPASIIQHAIWLYLRFSLSYRDVEELLAERGLYLFYETIRRWVLKFGPLLARRLRQRAPGRATAGTSMRWSCGSPGNACTCGAPSTRRAKSSISWSSLAGISGPP